MGSKELFAKADALRKEADEIAKQAVAAKIGEESQKPVKDRMVYSAFTRCPCGAGMAYDPLAEDENSTLVGPLSGYWDCSAIILGVADPKAKHEAKLPFAFYNIKSEGQPSAGYATTRPKE